MRKRNKIMLGAICFFISFLIFADAVPERYNVIVSREEFNRIFKVYDKYEKFLEERGLTNGEIDIAIHMIRESYEHHMKEHTFLEDVRGFSK